jgi:hypothetical protein
MAYNNHVAVARLVSGSSGFLLIVALAYRFSKQLAYALSLGISSVVGVAYRVTLNWW